MGQQSAWLCDLLQSQKQLACSHVIYMQGSSQVGVLQAKAKKKGTRGVKGIFMGVVLDYGI